jgi:hypothetical protein
MVSDTATPLTAFEYDDEVPAPVITRWNRIDQDRAVLTDLALLLVTVGAAIGAVAGLGALVFGIPAGLGLGLAGIAMALIVLAHLARRILVRRGILLSTRDLDLVITHRAEVCFPVAESVSEEAAFALQARIIADDIVASPAWSSAVLGEHPDQLDPVEEARRIHVAAWRLQQFRSQLGEEPTGDDPLAVHSAVEWRQLTGQAAATLSGLRARVDALEQYRTDLRDLSETLRRAERLAALRALADEHGALLALDQATHELAAERVTALDLQAIHHRAELLADGEPPSPDRPR